MKLLNSTRLFAVIAIPVALAAAGCQKKATDGVPTASVTDLAAPAPMAAYTPAPVQPVYDSTPVAPTPASYATNSYGTAGSTGAGEMGGTYKVKKGDTLFGIARTHYGDGKQWTKIAAANPGLSPQSLKVGQTINVP